MLFAINKDQQRHENGDFNSHQTLSCGFWGYGFWVFLCTTLGASLGFIASAIKLANLPYQRAVGNEFWEFPAMLIGAVLGYGFSTIAVLLVGILRKRHSPTR